ncbi:MAG TPA: hypothetical protein VJ858_06575 [Acidimicrobiia bacterium]|nr:hypothetical protein [Acidimicrobiia bacterium]
MTRWVLVLALVFGCAADDEAVEVEVSCETPPDSEMTATSALRMEVDPNPTVVGEVVALTIAESGLTEDALSGVDAGWQCWDGSEWVTTHVVYRGFGNHAGQTIPVNSEFQIRVPSIGLEVGEGYPIVIPEVEPGTYRIEDEVHMGDESVSGFVIVGVEG